MIGYHFVFCPKYRKDVFKAENIKATCESLIRSICESKRIRVIALETMPDHLHLLVEAPATITASCIANSLKGVTSRELRKRYPALRRVLTDHLWATGYYVAGIGEVSKEQVKLYINNQERVLARAKA